jgi:hypothetical protein
MCFTDRVNEVLGDLEMHRFLRNREEPVLPSGELIGVLLQWFKAAEIAHAVGCDTSTLYRVRSTAQNLKWRWYVSLLRFCSERLPAKVCARRRELQEEIEERVATLRGLDNFVRVNVDPFSR